MGVLYELQTIIVPNRKQADRIARVHASVKKLIEADLLVDKTEADLNRKYPSRIPKDDPAVVRWRNARLMRTAALAECTKED